MDHLLYNEGNVNPRQVKLFTHTDLDGISCYILSVLAFGKENVSVEYCNYSDVNTKVEDYLRSNFKEDTIYITDISVSEELADKIDAINNNIPKLLIKLFDHHKTSEWLNRYSWAKVQEHTDKLVECLDREEIGRDATKCKVKTSGTELFYNHLVNTMFLSTTLETQLFVEKVTLWDTWRWKEINWIEPKQWNDLFYIYGRDRFIDIIIDRIYDERLYLTNTDKLLLELEEEKKKSYIEKKQEQIGDCEITVDYNNKFTSFTVGVVFAESYISELGNYLAENNQEYDFVAIVNIENKTVSLRGVKEIDLSIIAKYYGGGGHQKASGFTFDSIINDNLITSILYKPIII